MNLNLLAVFDAVAQTGSFTRAGQRLGVDKSRVSRAVSALEASLGSALLVRTTRQVRLTREGAALAARVAPLLESLREAVSEVPEQGSAPSGEVVLTATPDVARALVAPLLPAFRLQFPEVRVQLRLEPRVVDLMRADVDLALRVGRPGSGALVARKVAELSAGFFAAPQYLERRGVPQALGDLASHEGLWPMPEPGQRSFSPAGLARDARPPAVATEDFGLLCAVAKAGGGVALLPLFLVQAEAPGTLVRVLPEVTLGGAPLSLVSRAPKTLPARVMALRSFLLARL
jgi:DNA-binding transcriptional LysR family regulator